MALLEGCKHALEISVPVTDVEHETERVVASIQKKARLPGFRPGKAPASLIRSRFVSDIRQEVLESLIPRFLQQKFAEDQLRVVGRPDITDVHFHQGEPLRFKAEFEVAPEVEIGAYRDIEVTYREPEVSDADVARRLEEIREQKAEYVNIDPRPVEDGDYAVVALHSLAGVEGTPIEQVELVLHVGDEDTLPAFTENLRGMSPEEEKEFDVIYPGDYAQERLSGRTIRFRVKLTMIRRKDLPDLDDDFAQGLGDYQNLEELREAVRKSLFREREFAAQQQAKDSLVDKLVDAHEFPVPEVFLDRQIEIQVENHLRSLAMQGVDPRSVQLDWAKIKQSQREKAIREVRASLLLEKIAEREAIETTNDEVDREVQRIARQEREPAAAVRIKLEKDGSLRRIAARIRTEKSLNFLFEHARKVAG